MVFQPPRDREFWDEIQAVLDKYPETTRALTYWYSDQDPFDESDADRITQYGAFDASSPVIHHGIVMAIVVRNMQGYETMYLISPPEQSAYLTDGIITNAYSRI